MKVRKSASLLAMCFIIGCSPLGGDGSDGPQDAGADAGRAVVLDAGSDAIPDVRPELMPDVTADVMVEATLDAMPDVMPDATPDADPPASPGCGRAPIHPLGAAQIDLALSPAAGGARGAYLTLPADYDPATPHRLVIAYAGTNWSGGMIRPYFDFERVAEPDEIFVYPDLLRRDFGPWGTLGGWLLGPHAAPADGMEDIEFTRELVAYLGEQYCVDPDRVFATGHSWGGDMAAVAACFLGDVIRAAAPAAANRPYWFEPVEGTVGCVGTAAVWTFFGEADEHFSAQPYPGAYGDEQAAFWRGHHGCGEGMDALDVGIEGACVAYPGCAVETRYCLYSPATGHQIPAGFTDAVMGWFRGF